jgi:hypothetical protein
MSAEAGEDLNSEGGDTLFRGRGRGHKRGCRWGGGLCDIHSLYHL